MKKADPIQEWLNAVPLEVLEILVPAGARGDPKAWAKAGVEALRLDLEEILLRKLTGVGGQP